jgi:hypothetical protein
MSVPRANEGTPRAERVREVMRSWKRLLEITEDVTGATQPAL